MAGSTNVQKTKTNYRKPGNQPKPVQPPAPSAANPSLGKVTGKDKP